MNDITQQIELFANKILRCDIRHDLLRYQQATFGKFIKQSIPVDTASKSCPIPFTQLMKSVGNFDEEVLDQLNINSMQDRQNYKLMCVAGASGMGKTHLAYSIGRKRSCNIIRVCEPGSGLRNSLSLPWFSAYNLILSVLSVSSSDPKVDRAQSAMRVVELLLFCYVEATCIASQCAENPNDKRELILRYHRNTISEGHIYSLFETQLQLLRRDDNHYLLDDEQCRRYFDEVSKLANKELDKGLVLCLDEILVLAKLCEDTFCPNATDTSQRETIEQAQTNGTQIHMEDGEMVDFDANRGLLYLTLCCVRSICYDRGWTSFVTGTSASLRKFRIHPDNTSSMRGSTISHGPNQLLTVNDMIDLLQHYFHWDSTAFSEEVRNALQWFSGRPLFFERGVFQPLLSYVVDSIDIVSRTVNMKKLSGATLLRVIEPRTVLQERLLERFEKVFGAKPIPLRHRTKSLISPLVDALLTNDQVTFTEQQMEDAILIGLFPISKTDNSDARLCGLEPLVREALFEYFRSERRPDLESIWLQTLDSSGKGSQAEMLMARRIALKSLLYRLRNDQRPISLNILLQSLLPPQQHGLLHEDFQNMYCHVDTVKSLTDEISDVFLRHLVRPRQRKSFSHGFVRMWKDTFRLPHADTSKLDYQSILMNIDKDAGVDLCFLVTFDSPLIQPDTQCHLVALKVTTQGEGTLNDALISIHPGTQYLTNDQRQYFIRHFTGTAEPTFPRERSHPSAGVGGSKWQRYRDFSQSFPFLCKDWIRVVVVARPIANAVLTAVKELPLVTNSRPELERTHNERLLRSLIAVVSMKDISGVDHSRLTNVVTGTTGTTSVLSLPTETIHWVPLEVDDVEKMQKTASPAT